MLDKESYVNYKSGCFMEVIDVRYICSVSILVNIGIKRLSQLKAQFRAS